MKSTRKLMFAGFAAAALALLVQNPMPVAAGQQNGNQGNNTHTLRLRAAACSNRFSSRHGSVGASA
jgi:hypothetical protein